MQIEKILELKLKYQKEVDYFSKLGFDILASKFKEIVILLDEMEKECNNAAAAIEDARVPNEDLGPAPAQEGVN